MTIAFNQLSHWVKPQTLCLTSSQANSELLVLAMQLKKIANDFGVTMDNRPYLPHVTLAKKVKRPMALQFKPIIWESGEFCLFESITAADGVVYRVLNTWPLTG